MVKRDPETIRKLMIKAGVIKPDDTRKSPNTRAKHPLTKLFPPGKWRPELVGVVPGYPPTQEYWEAQSKRMTKALKDDYNPHRDATRRSKCYPRGWAHRKDEVDAIRLAASVKAKADMARMKKAALIAPDENPRVELALESCCAVLRAETDEGKPLESAQARVAASRVLLDFLKARPAATQNLNISTAEDFLESLAADGAE